MLPEIGIVIYNSESINTWEVQVASLHRKARGLNDERTTTITLLEKTKQEIRLTQESLNVRRSRKRGRGSNTAEHDERLKLFDREIKSYEEKLQRLLNEERIFTDKLNNNAQQLAEIPLEIEKREQDISNARDFLRAMKNNPEDLFESKLALVFDVLQKLDGETDQADEALDHTFAKLSHKKNMLACAKFVPNTRFPRYVTRHYDDVYAHLEELNHKYRRQNLQTKDDIEEERKLWRLRYAFLNGFLSDLYEQHYRNKASETLRAAIITLLKEMHIQENGDLPNEFRLGASTYAQFRRLKEEYREIFNLSAEEMQAYAEKQFDDAKSALGSYAQVGHALPHKNAAKLIDAITLEIAKCQTTHKKIPYKELTRVMTYTYDIYHALDRNEWTEKNDDDVEHLLKIATTLPGKTSNGKRITGAILATIGVALMSASVATLVVTFGGLTMPSLVSVAFSSTLIAKGAAMVGGLSGIGFTIAGFSLFHQGRQQGLKRAVMQNLDLMNEWHRKSLK